MSKDVSGAIPAKFVLPLNMNKLRGRMLYLPGKKQDILLVYDLRSNIEKYYELAKNLHRYGSVTLPDLPGFGGMQSFYKIGEKPDLDKLADYLATFVRWRFKRRQLIIFGHGFGFAVVTRMLQKYPDISKNVNLLVSLTGYGHKDDLNISKAKAAMLRSIYFIASFRVFDLMVRLLFLRKHVLGLVYKSKFIALPQPEKNNAIKSEIRLWRNNDLRTWACASTAKLALDNCNYTVDLPVWHVWVARDPTLHNNLVYQHLKIIYNDVHKVKILRNPNNTNSWNELVTTQIKTQLRKTS